MQFGEPRAQISQRGSLEKLGSRKAKVKKKMKALNGGTTWTRFEASLASRRVHSAIWGLKFRQHWWSTVCIWSIYLRA